MIFTLLAATGLALAQPEEDRRAKAAAAHANAVAALQQQVSEAAITTDLSVRDFLARTDSAEALRRTLAKAEQIGGPRWINDQICQVRVEMSGVRVAAALLEIAKNAPSLSPISPGRLQAELSAWKNRSFSVTGTSFSVDEASKLDPALIAARADAVNKIVEQLRSVSLPGRGTIGDALAEPAAQKQILEWLNNRSISHVRVDENRKLWLTLDVPPQELADVIQKTVAPAGAANAWAPTRQQIAGRLGAVSGSATFASQTQPANADWRANAEIPRWVNDRLEAEGFSAKLPSKLRTARAAEADATSQIRLKLLQLPLGKNSTVGEVAKTDWALVKAVDRALLRAGLEKTQYHPDGSVTVRAFLELSAVWDILSQPGR